MQHTFRIGIFLFFALLATPAHAAGKLDALFNQESGAGNRTAPDQTAPNSSKQGRSSLEGLMQQEQQQEAEARRKKEEQDRIAAEQQRQQQRMMEQRRQYEAAERERSDEYDSLVKNCRLSKAGCDGNCLGAGMGGAMIGSRSASMGYYECQRTCESQNRDCLETAERGQRQNVQVNPAQKMLREAQQEQAEKQQREQAERQRREQQQAEQNEAARRRVEANNRYYENKNRQDAENFNRQQQAANEQRQRQQHEEQERQREAKERQRKEKEARRFDHNPANDAKGCVGADDNTGHEFGQQLVNKCGFPIEVTWCVNSNDEKCSGRYIRTATIRPYGRNPIKDGFRIQGPYTYQYVACKGANTIHCMGGYDCRCPDNLQK